MPILLEGDVDAEERDTKEKGNNFCDNATGKTGKYSGKPCIAGEYRAALDTLFETVDETLDETQPWFVFWIKIGRWRCD